MKTAILIPAAIAALTLTGSACATLVEVAITGEVEFNQISGGEFGGVNSGDAASLTFLLDSDIFTNSGSFNTRGYHIDQSSFQLNIGSANVGLENPFPGTPYFVLRDQDPAVDGFFIADNVDFPSGVATDETGIFGQFVNNFSVGYTEDTLSSLDLLDAIGTYDFTGLTNFNWTIDDGPFNAMGLIFEQMTISVVPAPGVLGVLAFAGLGCARRRREQIDSEGRAQRVGQRPEPALR